MAETKKYLTYEGLQEYHNGMKDHITEVVESQSSPTPDVITLKFPAGSKFAVYATNPMQPTLRCYGHVVELHGEIQPIQSITGGANYHEICTIPEEYAPHHDIAVIQQGTSQAIWMLHIFKKSQSETSCKVAFSRYRNGDSYANASVGTWLPFHATWVV